MPNPPFNLDCPECRKYIGHPTTLSDVYCSFECPGCKMILVFTDDGWAKKKTSLEKILDHSDKANENFVRGIFNGR